METHVVSLSRCILINVTFPDSDMLSGFVGQHCNIYPGNSDDRRQRNVGVSPKSEKASQPEYITNLRQEKVFRQWNLNKFWDISIAVSNIDR
jgi:hypothetical protein